MAGLTGAGVSLLLDLPSLGDAVRSLAFQLARQEADPEQLLLACGLEAGHIRLLHVDLHAKEAARVWQTASHTLHSAAVRRLCWSESCREPDQQLLASCGDDHAVKVFRVSVQAHDSADRQA